MDTETFFYVFGPALALIVGMAIAFGCQSYAVYKGRIR